jgi:hypothetical protein
MEHTCEFCALLLPEINLTVQSPPFFHDIVLEPRVSELRVSSSVEFLTNDVDFLLDQFPFLELTRDTCLVHVATGRPEFDLPCYFRQSESHKIQKSKSSPSSLV